MQAKNQTTCYNNAFPYKVPSWLLFSADVKMCIQASDFQPLCTFYADVLNVLLMNRNKKIKKQA